MPTTLTVDNDTIEALVEKLANARYSLTESPTDHAAFLLLHESNPKKLLPAAYGPQREDNVGDIHPNTFGILKAVVNNTWHDNREDQPGEPVAGVIQCDLEAKSATVTYHLGNEAEAWRFNDDNSMELRA